MSLVFAADWLGLREPADHRARSARVTEAALAALAGKACPLVVDLGCGRGSNLRFLAPLLPPGTRWRLVDHDSALLAAAGAGLTGVERVRADLRTADLGALCAGADLVTAAALLDLVTASWLEALLAAAPRGLLATGNVDGRVDWRPALPLDAVMTAAFHTHHAGDKGFGVALGSRAPAVLRERAAAHRRSVVAEPADWQLDAGAGPLQRAYLEGAVAAIAETGVDPANLASWADERRRRIEAGQSRLAVGHVDLFVGSASALA